MVDLLFDWFGMSCMTTDNFHFYLQNRLIKTGQIRGELYSDTFLFSVPWLGISISLALRNCPECNNPERNNTERNNPEQT